MSAENLLTIKAVLIRFELSLSIKVNFSKIFLELMWVDLFLDWDEDFLHCKAHSLPFKYFRLPVGANHRGLRLGILL